MRRRCFDCGREFEGSGNYCPHCVQKRQMNKIYEEQRRHNREMERMSNNQHYGVGSSSYGDSSGCGCFFIAIILIVVLIAIFVPSDTSKDKSQIDYKTCETCKGKGKTDEICGKCSAKGYIECTNCDNDGMIRCPDCGGTGTIETQETSQENLEELDDEGNPIESSENVESQCSRCDGYGTDLCPLCNGKKQIKCKECHGKGTVPMTCLDCEGKGKVKDDSFFIMTKQ